MPDGSASCATCGQTFASAPRRGAGPPKPPRRRPADIPGAYKPGERIAGRYEVQSVLGQGPIGVVYRALDREVDVQVAVKVVTPKLVQAPEERETFKREARVARSLAHPNIVRIYEEGFDGDRPFLVMQHLEGLTLRKIIDLRQGKNQRFTLKEIEPIFAQLTAALDHAHEQGAGGVKGVAHGDLKPENVIVLPDLLKVTDFREAAFVPRVPFVAAQKVRGGSERYLAPEVVAGQTVGPRADVYSLGVLLGEMLTGEVFDPGRGLDLHVVNGHLPRAVDGIFKRCVASLPGDRYEKAGHVGEDLAAVIAGELPAYAGVRDGRVPTPAPIRGGPVAASEDEGLLGSGDFELLDADDDPREDTSADRPSRRVSFGLEDEAPPPPIPEEALDEGELVVRDDEVLDPADLDDAFEDEGEDELRTAGGAGAPPRPAEALGEDTRREDLATLNGGDPVTEGPTRISGYPAPPPGRVHTPEPTVEERALAPSRGGGWGLYAALAAVGVIGGVSVALVYTGQGRALWARLSGGAAEPSAPSEAVTAPIGGASERAVPAAAEAAVAPAGGGEGEGDEGAPDRAAPAPTPTTTRGLRTAAAEPARPRRESPRRDEAERARAHASRPKPIAPVVATREERAREPAEAAEPAHRTPPEPAPDPAADEGRKVAAVSPTVSGAAASRCPKGMAFVPAGPFKIGSAINDPMRNFAERVLADVDVQAYCIDRYEYGAGGHTPMTGVTWYQAKKLCEKQGRRLCSEEEWEKACKGPRNLRFPYGNVFDANACNTEDADGNDRPVGRGGAFSRCRSGFGAFDMAGNVAEWTSSKFQANLGDRTQKGGAADRPDWDTRCATRANRSPNTRDRYLGFRCCADPE